MTCPTDPVFPMPLDAAVRALTEGPNFAAMTTLFADGAPQTQIMWVGSDEEHVLINTEVHRAKFANVQRDPRVTVTIWNAEQPYQYVEVRGRVVETITGPEARAHIDTLARRYRGTDGYDNQIQSERVLLKIVADKVIKNGL